MATINDYTKTEWVNDTTPAIDAEHLNKVEEGIYDNRVAVNELLTDIDTKAPSVSPTLKFAVKDSADGNTNPHAEFRTMGNSPSKSVGFAVYDENGNGTYYDLIKGDGTRYFAIVPEVNLKAPLASPALTGTPTAPTAPVGTNTTQIATTAYVQSSLDGWRFYDKDAFTTSQTLATICATLPSYSIWVKNIGSTSDFGGVPSVGLLQITKFTASRCILEINYATASANESRKYVASFKSGSSAISEWTRLMQESDLYFSAGDTYASLAGFQTAGMTTNGNKNLYLTVTVPKLLTNINNITVTRMIGAMRGINGYVGGSSDGNFDWLTQSYISRVTAAKVADNQIRIIIVTDTALSNATNNTPVVFNGQVTFTFS